MTELDEIKEEANRIVKMHNDCVSAFKCVSKSFESVKNSICINTRRIERAKEIADALRDNENASLATTLANKYMWIKRHCKCRDEKEKAFEIAEQIYEIAEKLGVEGCPTEKNVSSAILALAKFEKSVSSAVREIEKCSKCILQMRMAIAGLNSAITTRLAGAGVERLTDLGSEGKCIVDEVYTDNGFLDTRKKIEKTANAFGRMQIALDAIGKAPDALEGIRHKHKKLLDRMANSRAAKGSAEYKTAQTMSSKMAKMENIITDRAGVFLDEFGKCARRTLNRTLGLVEQMEDAIKTAKLTKCAKSSLVNIDDVTMKITTKYNEAKGDK